MQELLKCHSRNCFCMSWNCIKKWETRSGRQITKLKNAPQKRTHISDLNYRECLVTSYQSWSYTRLLYNGYYQRLSEESGHPRQGRSWRGIIIALTHRKRQVILALFFFQPDLRGSRNRTLPDAVYVTVRRNQPVNLVGMFEKTAQANRAGGL